MKVVYTYSLYHDDDDDDSILASFWLITCNEKLTLWSSLPHSIFQFKKEQLMPEPLPWSHIEPALYIMFQIIDWVRENDYHTRFSYHELVSESNRESFYFAIDYRAIYHHHPQINFCSADIKEYHFIRFKQEYEACEITCPTSFYNDTIPTTRAMFESYINDCDNEVKDWYIDNYHRVKRFNLDENEDVNCIYVFDANGGLLAVAFSKFEEF